MQQIDVDSQLLTSEDHKHIEECSSCCSYFEADQEIMSQLKQCLAIKVPDTLQSDMKKYLNKWKHIRVIKNNKIPNYKITSRIRMVSSQS